MVPSSPAPAWCPPGRTTTSPRLVRSIAARVQVLNAGELVESGFVVEVLDTPQEAYTKRLLSSSPAVN